MRKRAAPIEGWWVNETVPDLGKILTPGLGVDSAEFARWLGPHLGQYRGVMHVRESMPSRGAELDFTKEAIAAIAAAEKILGPRSIPDRVDAETAYQGLVAEINWLEFRERLARDLRLARLLMQKTVTKLAAAPARPGRKKDVARDRLVAAVVDQLQTRGLKADLARNLAREVLRACDVQVLDPKRSTRRGQK